MATSCLAHLQIIELALGAGGEPWAIATIDISDAWRQTSQWIAECYRKVPALVLGLAAIAALLPLALAGPIMRRAARGGANATRLIRRRGTSIEDTAVDGRTQVPAWPSRAWITAEGGRPIAIQRSVVRIGREMDNDVCIPHDTVHRYHAAIHRTEDAEFVITDLSSCHGNGVTVDGRRVHESKLYNGNVIELGAVKLTFSAAPR